MVGVSVGAGVDVGVLVGAGVNAGWERVAGGGGGGLWGEMAVGEAGAGTHAARNKVKRIIVRGYCFMLGGDSVFSGWADCESVQGAPLPSRTGGKLRLLLRCVIYLQDWGERETKGLSLRK